MGHLGHCVRSKTDVRVPSSATALATKDLLAGSQAQEAFLFFRRVNKLWLLLYFSAETSPFCLNYQLLLWSEYLQTE